MKLEDRPALLKTNSPCGIRMFVLASVIDCGATAIKESATNM